MAFDKTPSAWFEDWSEDGTNIAVPIATFPELTEDEADGTTGDIRKILFALLEKIAAEWAERATADRPAQMTLQKSVTTDLAPGYVTNTYMFRFNTTILTQEVAAEA